MGSIGHAVWSAVSVGIFGWFIRGCQSFLTWTLNAMVSELTRATTPAFAVLGSTHNTSLFLPIWDAMTRVGLLVSVVVLFIGVTATVIRGESGLLARQVLIGLAATLLMASPVPRFMAQGLFDGIDGLSRFIFAYGAGAGGIGKAVLVPGWFNSRVTAMANSLLIPARYSIETLLFLIVATILSIFVWFEMVIREAIAYLVMALVPLALAGAYWKTMWSWTRRAVELLVAIAFSQLVIAILVTLAIDSFAAMFTNSGFLSLGGIAAEGMMCLSFLFLATLGLPMAMRVVPMALAHGGDALAAMEVSRHLRGRVSTMAKGAHAGASSHTGLQRDARAKAEMTGGPYAAPKLGQTVSSAYRAGSLSGVAAAIAKDSIGKVAKGAKRQLDTQTGMASGNGSPQGSGTRGGSRATPKPPAAPLRPKPPTPPSSATKT